MIDLFLTFFALTALTLGLGILSNFHREHRQYKILLKPNCLLTRYPVVFLTGQRSLFYFRKYWNAYPEILAEHGYEVFTLHLPWRGPARSSRMKNFLHNQTASKKFHFICDFPTEKDFRMLFKESACAASVTIFESETPPSYQTRNFGLNLAYQLHAWYFINDELPRATDLGLHFPHEVPKLLVKMQALGEQDFLNG